MKRSLASIVRNYIISAIGLALTLTIPANAAQETPWDVLTGFPALITMQTYHEPSIASVMGKTHLFYEIYVLNAYGSSIDVTSLRVLADGRELAKFRGETLAAMMAPIGVPAEKPSRTITAAETAVFYLDVPFATAHDVPKSLQDEMVFSAGGHQFTVTQRAVAVTATSPLVINSPLQGDGWFASSAPANDTGHRRTIFYRNGRPYLGQRFAIDWLQAKPDANHHLSFFHGDPKKNASWYCWNAPVFAVADGTVVAERTDLPENVPLEKPIVPISQQTIGGNYIVIDIGFGRYAFYAHLRPHSATVKTGDRVRQGQIVGRVGNTGNSSGPHLHFHLTDAPEFIFAEGEPYAFLHMRAATSKLDSDSAAEGVTLTSPFETYANTMPGDGAVVDFGSKL